jgi:DNA-binding MarR family transcriptional regulator
MIDAPQQKFRPAVFYPCTHKGASEESCSHPECAPIKFEQKSHATLVFKALGERSPQLPSELASRLGLDRSEISRQLRGLRNADYVERYRKGRTFPYQLSWQGRSLYEATMDWMEQCEQAGEKELLRVRYAVIPQAQRCFALVREQVLPDGRRETKKLTLGTRDDCLRAFNDLSLNLALSPDEAALQSDYTERVGRALAGEFAE